jgi:hypothetical protein
MVRKDIPIMYGVIIICVIIIIAVIYYFYNKDAVNNNNVNNNNHVHDNDGKCNTKVSCELYKCKNNMIDCITGNPGDSFLWI